MTTLETNILRALTAYKVEHGMSAKDASAWAVANLSQGLAKWSSERATQGADPELDSDAYEALKEWAQAQ